MVIFCNTVCIRDVIINSTHFAINLQLLKEFGQEAQLPQRNSASAAHVEGARPSSPLHLRPLWLHLCVWSNSKATTYVCQVCRPLSHFKVNRAFKVIQGHPYWCRQESRMVCCRNGNTANSSISTTPLTFEDVPARNAFEYLQMIYIARN